MRTFVIEALLSQDQNVSVGVGKAPDRVMNLSDHRAGGYSPYGRVATVTSGFAQGIGKLIGYDAYGFASFLTDTGSIRLWRASNPASALTGSEQAPEAEAVHVARAGAWANARAFHVFDRHGNTFRSAHTEDRLTVTVLESDSEPFEPGSYHVMAVFYCETESGRFYLGHSTPERVIIYGAGQTIRVTAPSTFAGVKAEVFIFVGTSDNLNAHVATSAAVLESAESFTFAGVPTGFSIGQFGRFVVPELNPVCPAAVQHGGRLWGVAGNHPGRYRRRGVSLAGVSFPSPDRTLLWSETGWLNLMGPSNYRVVDGQNSARITGLLPTPGGLLIFMDNEAQLLTGSEAPFSVRPVPGSVGCDAGTVPCLHKGIAYTIWRGRLYEVGGGRSQQVGRPAWLPQARLVQVVSEPVSGHLLVVNESNSVYRYNPETLFWSENTASGVALHAQTQDLGLLLLPNPGDDGTLYATRSPAEFLTSTPPGTGDEPEESIDPPLGPDDKLPFGALADAVTVDFDPYAFQGTREGGLVVSFRSSDKSHEAVAERPYEPYFVPDAHRGLPAIRFWSQFWETTPAGAVADPLYRGTTLWAPVLSAQTFHGPAGAPGKFTLMMVLNPRRLSDARLQIHDIFGIHRSHEVDGDGTPYLTYRYDGDLDELLLTWNPSNVGGTGISYAVTNVLGSGDTQPRILIAGLDCETGVARVYENEAANPVDITASGTATSPVLGADQYVRAGFGVSATYQHSTGVTNPPPTTTEYDFYRFTLFNRVLTATEMTSLMTVLKSQYRGE